MVFKAFPLTTVGAYANQEFTIEDALWETLIWHSSNVTHPGELRHPQRHCVDTAQGSRCESNRGMGSPTNRERERTVLFYKRITYLPVFPLLLHWSLEQVDTGGKPLPEGELDTEL